MTAASPAGRAARVPRRWPVITALGLTQIMAWGSSYYLLAVLAAPIAADTGWPLGWVVGGLSIGLLAASLISPAVGRSIARRGGRPVLAGSAVLLSIGLLGLALAHSLPAFFAAWLVIGLGMGAGLYDPAFAAIGRLYGESGRSAITALTLFGGFASTVWWPLSAFLVAHVGWRGACLVYAGIQLAVALPTYLFGLPREAAHSAEPAAPGESGPASAQATAPGRAVFLMIAASVTLAHMISTVFSVHLLTILQGKGVALAAAVGLGAIVGPSQVGARAVELLVARRQHPIWTKLAAVSLVASGLGLLWAGGGPLMTLALVFYGAGIGLESIARGTLPLAVFGPERYPVVVGKIAMPNLLAQAAAPLIGAGLLAAYGFDGSLAVFAAAAVCNVALACCLLLTLRSLGRG